MRQTAISIAALIAIAGCSKQQELREDEALKVVVAEDRKIARKEEELLAKRGVLQRERVRIRDERASLVSKKLAASEDPNAKAQLEAEESKLVRLEQRLVSQELQLNRRLERLIERKSGLAAGKDDKQVKVLLLARREHSVAVREKDLGQRESDIARRERVLAERERAFALRQAKLCPAAVTTVIHSAAPGATARPGVGSGRYSRRDVEPVYRAGLAAMRRKGVLVADLPPGVDRFVTEVRHAVSRGDFGQAKSAADQLLAAVRAIRIDRAFIGAKIGRLSAAIRRRPLDGSKKTRVERLFQQATAAYGDGRLGSANKMLNQIYGLMR